MNTNKRSADFAKATTAKEGRMAKTTKGRIMKTNPGNHQFFTFNSKLHI